MKTIYTLAITFAVLLTSCGKAHTSASADDDASTEPEATSHVTPANLEFYETYPIENIADKIQSLTIDPQLLSVDAPISEIFVEFMPAPSLPIIGNALPGDTARINNIFAYASQMNLLPPDMKPMWTARPNYDYARSGNATYSLLALRTCKGQPALDGSAISDVSVDKSPQMGPVINLSMTKEGAKRWERITQNNIGFPIAMAIDGKVYSYPTVNSVIEGGKSQITGDFSEDEARDLAARLRARSVKRH